MSGGRVSGPTHGPGRGDRRTLEATGGTTSEDPLATRIAIALGSNLGNRTARIDDGLRTLRRFVDDLRVSSLYETEPRYVVDQPSFLNACAAGVTRLTPRQVLAQLQDGERAAGRRRGGAKYGPRELDLDLLLFGRLVLREPDLVVPHPHLRVRAFVLVPLAEIAGDWIVPACRGSPAESVAALATRVGSEGVMRLPGGAGT
jgi:2-amino-4-hydroxy-6-hydroxymethyldihydropteridine diphosphokinase